MFPQSLIDQWLSKSREGRRSVKDDPKATPAILDNIRHLELYCAAHPYHVFCASSLRSPPFALYALEEEAAAKARLSAPPLFFSSTVGAIGGRYEGGADQRKAASAAHQQSVVARLTGFLKSWRDKQRTDSATATAATVAGLDEQVAAEVASIVVRVMTEAAVAAAIRTGVAAKVEADERAAFSRRQSRRRLQLRVRGTADSAAAASPRAPSAAHDDDGAGDDDVYIAARPIAEYRRNRQALLSLTALLCGPGAFTGAQSSSASSTLGASEKRGRDDAGVSCWAQLRETVLRRRYTTQPPPPPPVPPPVLAGVGTQHAPASAQPADDGWAVSPASEKLHFSATGRYKSVMARRAIDAVCTMATLECAEELALLHRSLRTFHRTLPLFLACTSELQDATAPASASTLRAVHADPYVRWVPCLDVYGPTISRAAMERQPGVWYATRHTDFMMEKANLMELAMRSSSATGEHAAPLVAFLDCDIALLGELPTLPPGATVALSPHAIRSADEALFGRFNGGYVVASDPEVLWEWRRATANSRYFDQASLEHVADVFAPRGQLHHLPPQHNYGFWRLLQPQGGTAFDEARRFSVGAMQNATPHIQYDGCPLRSVHTHFFLYGDAAPPDVRLFNGLLRRWIAECARGRAGEERNRAYAEAFESIL